MWRSNRLGVYIAVFLIIAITVVANLGFSTAIGEAPRKRVVIISVDAMRFDHVFRLAAEGVLGNFSKILSSGAYARMVVVYPTATAVSHASISTGAPPGVTGIVANSIHLPGTAVTSTVSGFNGSYMQAEPLWAAADRQGLKAVVLSFPQSTPPAWNVSRSILFNVYDTSAPFTYSTLYTTNRSVPRAAYVTLTEASGWLNIEKLGSVAKALETNITIGDTVWYLLLVDFEGDGRYDRLVIAPEKDTSKAYAILSEGEWSQPINTTITYRGVTYIVAPRFKVLNLTPANFRLYRGITRPFNPGVWYNNFEAAWDLWNSVVARVGMFTDGDYYALNNEWIDVETYMETVYFTNAFFKEATLHFIKRYDWDLLMSYTSVVDNVYHQFLGLTDPSTPYYDPAKADYYWSLIVRTYRWVDEFIGEVLSSVDLRNTAVVVVSDHGQYPVKKVVNINAVLYNAGLLGVSGGAVQVNVTKAYYVGHGHIYVNLQGREVGGVVSPEQYRTVVEAVVRALAEVRDPDTGLPVFDLILTRDQLAALGLDNPRSGDVVFALKVGYTAAGGVPTIDPQTGRAVVFTTPTPLKTVTGDHGVVLPFYPELWAFFGAVGGGLLGRALGFISSLMVAPFAAQILGIEPPRNALALYPPMVVTTTAFTPTTVTTTLTQIMTYTTTSTKTETTTVTTVYPTTVTTTTTETNTATTTVPTTVTVRETAPPATTTTAIVRTVTQTITFITTASIPSGAIIAFGLSFIVSAVLIGLIIVIIVLVILLLRKKS